VAAAAALAREAAPAMTGSARTMLTDCAPTRCCCVGLAPTPWASFPQREHRVPRGTAGVSGGASSDGRRRRQARMGRIWSRPPRWGILLGLPSAGLRSCAAQIRSAQHGYGGSSWSPASTATAGRPAAIRAPPTMLRSHERDRSTSIRQIPGRMPEVWATRPTTWTGDPGQMNSGGGPGPSGPARVRVVPWVRAKRVSANSSARRTSSTADQRPAPL